MTFNELLPLLQQYKYAMRPNADHYIFMIPGNGEFWVMFYKIEGAKPQECIFTIDDFLANDWEIINKESL